MRSRTSNAVAAMAHLVLFSQSVLDRGAGLDVVWPQFLAVLWSAACSSALRFRSVAARST
jgi:hypothetical protein